MTHPIPPEHRDWLEQQFKTVFPSDIPKPVAPEQEQQSCVK